MKKSFLLLIAVVFLFACRKTRLFPVQESIAGIPWEDSSLSHPRSQEFLALIEKYNKKGLPGISLLIRDKNGTWCGHVGKADLENNIDFGIAQVSKIASISKFIINTLAYKLFEDSVNTHFGYAAINTKIKTWLPADMVSKIANADKVTLGQLMNHESGIPDIIEEDNFYLKVLNNPTKKWDYKDLVACIYNKPAVFVPSDTAIYSNTNIILITMIIEAATGRKHSELMHQYVLNPLGMNKTYYYPFDKLPANVAQGYYDLYNNNTLVNVSNMLTGGMYSNLFDLYKFLDAMLLKKNFLAPKSIQIMETWGNKPDSSNIYGYGIMKKFIERGDDYGIGHSGRDLGYTANLFYFPRRKVSHIFLINYGSDGESKLRVIFKQFQEELLNLTLK